MGTSFSTCHCNFLDLCVIVRWNHKLLTNLNLVGIAKLIAVRVEYTHIHSHLHRTVY